MLQILLKKKDNILKYELIANPVHMEMTNKLHFCHKNKRPK